METQPDVESKPEDVNTTDERVGDIDMEGGFGLGKAEPSAKPKETFQNSPTKGNNKATGNIDVGYKSGTEGFDKVKEKGQRPKMDRNNAFMEYKESAGVELVAEIEQDKTNLKTKKAELKIMHTEFTNLKDEVNKLSEEINSLKESASDDNELKTKEINLQDMKRSQKEKYTALKEMKENITELNKQTEEGMNRLLEGFEQW